MSEKLDTSRDVYAWRLQFFLQVDLIIPWNNLLICYQAAALCTVDKRECPAALWYSLECSSQSKAPCKSRRTSSPTNEISYSPLQKILGLRNCAQCGDTTRVCAYINILSAKRIANAWTARIYQRCILKTSVSFRPHRRRRRANVMRQINMEGMTLALQRNNKAEADFLEERRRDYSAFVRRIRSLVRAIRNKSYREERLRQGAVPEGNGY